MICALDYTIVNAALGSADVFLARAHLTPQEPMTGEPIETVSDAWWPVSIGTCQPYRCKSPKLAPGRRLWRCSDCASYLRGFCRAGSATRRSIHVRPQGRHHHKTFQVEPYDFLKETLACFRYQGRSGGALRETQGHALALWRG
jgi:hypothetical protein